MLSAALLLLAAAAAALPATETRDPVTIADGGSGRLQLRVTLPARGEGALPVVLFSHGAYLTRKDYAPLVRRLAAAGFAVIQPDHPDAGGAVSGGLAWRARIAQLHHLATHIEAVASADAALSGRLDASRVYAIGHSLGGHSVAALAGARRAGADDHGRNPAIRAAVLLAPPGEGGASLQPAWRERGAYISADWSSLAGPLLVITGSEDDTVVLTHRGPAWHEDIYWRSRARPACLVSLPGLKHFLGGIDELDDKPDEPVDAAAVESIARMATALFGGAPPADVTRLSGTGKATCR